MTDVEAGRFLHALFCGCPNLWAHPPEVTHRRIGEMQKILEGLRQRARVRSEGASPVVTARPDAQ
jgi:hypothetical protein